MILLIDNYDSFSYNLYQYVGVIDPDIRVIKNDEFSLAEIQKMNPSHIIISPGPGRPKDAGICEEVVAFFKDKTPLLGVCLGHQAICEVFGGEITYAKTLMHGKQSMAELDTATPLFAGLPPQVPVARYHSLAADPDTIPACLQVTARVANGEVMAVQHTTHPIFGVQFHPESIMTPDGPVILKNFIELTK